MTTFKKFHLRNEMFLANFLANLVAVFGVNGMMRAAGALPNTDIWQYAIPYWSDVLFTPLAFIFVAGMTLWYEWPIRCFLKIRFAGSSIPNELANKARQRLLNEPFVLIALDFSMWLFAAILYTGLHWMYGSGAQNVWNAFYHNLSIGVITVTVAFFLLEHLLQKRLAPYFFPRGGLSAIPRTLRIRIRTRLVALLLACNLIPLISIILILKRTLLSHSEPAQALGILNTAINSYAFLFIAVGICLTILVSRNLSIPFRDIIETLKRIRNGRFDKRVQVFSNDEIGYTGDAINEMTQGLIERERMQQSLNLAKEVQQNLLPKSNLRTTGFDIAGKSVYCDETGGDYYDFLSIGELQNSKIGVAIGDVSGHGISSALLMATVRASLRQRVLLPGKIADIISDVNRQLVEDVEDSGQFMTMFFMSLDLANKQIEWVRAGHNPGIIFDPVSDSFEELNGAGIALGVDEHWNFKGYRKADVSAGQIIFLSTDGVWEVRNPKGEMMGKEPILSVIRQHANSDAAHILEAIFGALKQFIGGRRIEDDITSVVIKSLTLN